MKKFLVIALLAVFVAASFGVAIAGEYGHGEPAPDAGDGIPDGSGF
ncbi:MAG: hypothetical protein KJ952_02840 [Candidatus Omnitrophica bacterium]|nr:hypothetical protein [Candidatus Omnitrophota bacterium]